MRKDQKGNKPQKPKTRGSSALGSSRPVVRRNDAGRPVGSDDLLPWPRRGIRRIRRLEVPKNRGVSSSWLPLLDPHRKPNEFRGVQGSTMSLNGGPKAKRQVRGEVHGAGAGLFWCYIRGGAAPRAMCEPEAHMEAYDAKDVQELYGS
ncbi:hypothetical protein EPI10_024978 [Gossypium australe]|uniref:Uncharacterized protein n=1 Tax=Gossypium australe TaxID=47621 RepID=A0A5B6W0L0_9ROSI|nr:hypothetical protein EPI10_024978 [Gossypium australe]